MGVFATQLGAEGEFNQNISKEPTTVPGTRRLKECFFSMLRIYKIFPQKKKFHKINEFGYDS